MENNIEIKQQIDNKTTKEKLEDLFIEAQAVKMASLRDYMHRTKIADELSPDMLKVSQMALKSIEIQMKVITEQAKLNEESKNDSNLDLIWKAMLDVPILGALIRRASVRKQIIDSLKKMADEKE